MDTEDPDDLARRLDRMAGILRQILLDEATPMAGLLPVLLARALKKAEAVRKEVEVDRRH